MARHASGMGGVSMPSSSLRSSFSVHSMPSSCCLRLTPALGSHTRRMSMKLLAARRHPRYLLNRKSLRRLLKRKGGRV